VEGGARVSVRNLAGASPDNMALALVAPGIVPLLTPQDVRFSDCWAGASGHTTTNSGLASSPRSRGPILRRLGFAGGVHAAPRQAGAECRPVVRCVTPQVDLQPPRGHGGQRTRARGHRAVMPICAPGPPRSLRPLMTGYQTNSGNYRPPGAAGTVVRVGVRGSAVSACQCQGAGRCITATGVRESACHPLNDGDDCPADKGKSTCINIGAHPCVVPRRQHQHHLSIRDDLSHACLP